MRGPLVFRVEAGPAIGSGHLMRCLALAEAHADRNGSAIFVTTGQAPALEDRVSEGGFEVAHIEGPVGTVEDASSTLGIAERARADFVFVDGYDFGPTYHQKLRSTGPPLAVMDDGKERQSQVADLVINQNLHASEASYRGREAHTRLLLGVEHVLLRREFMRFSKWRRKVSAGANRLLVTLGGSDPENVTENVVRALAPHHTVDATVVVGGANPRLERLEALAASAGAHIRIRANVRSMAAIMSRSDVAISSGGSTVWELAFMGLPAIVGASTAVEELVLGGLKKNDVFCLAGRFAANRGESIVDEALALLGDTSRRTTMSTRARALIDGNGTSRVLDAMDEVLAARTGRRIDMRGAVG